MGSDGRILINPSILNANYDDLENEIGRVSAVSDALHLDIMDNKFVPKFSFDFNRATKIIGFSKLPVDAHLMIEDPDTIAPRYAQAGCNSVSFHFEAVKNCRQTIADIKSNGAKVGIAIKPATPLSAIEEFLDEIDMLVVMTVEPGFGGQTFLSDQMLKVSQARLKINSSKGEPVILQVDGGISLITIEEAASAGANCFVAGSAVYKDLNPAEIVVKLRELAKNSFKI